MDQIALVYFWVEDCENCKNAQGLVEKVADENDGIFKAFHVDCEELWKDEEAR
jgi:thioredoxin-like negative regulator of GroEL